MAAQTNISEQERVYWRWDLSFERWKLIEQLFDRATNVDTAEREAWLARECAGDTELRAEVSALLESDHAAEGFLQEAVAQGILGFRASQVAAHKCRAGPYVLTRELGRGGMGTVYLGERADGQYKGEVAVKLVRAGMDTDFFLERFGRERQALARLQHANVARLLDSGTTEDGVPYIVMERVEGRPINSFSRGKNLDVTQILRLYLPVCQAVAHAHQNLIVHRDLKPGNILVEPSGTPKLLDFGICKLIEDGAGSETMTVARLMTPDYASPEQVRGDPITVASDIYSLGAVLYELLTGRPPHVIKQYTPQAIVQAVCETKVAPLSAAVEGDAALARLLKGDLDTILLKALHKEPERRYASVEQFAEDLRRVLDHEPVLARPDTALYRARKFARRHRASVTAAVLVAASLCAGVIGYARQAMIAQRQLAEARRLANAMMFDIHDRIRNLPGSLSAREAIVKTGLDYLDRMSMQARSDDALRREVAAAYLRMGEIQGNVLDSHTGDIAGALLSYSKGLAALEPLAESRDVGMLRMDLYKRLAQIQNSRHEMTQSLENHERGITIGGRLLQRYPGDNEVGRRLAQHYVANAIGLRALERRQEALDSSLRAIGVIREMLPRHPEDRELRAELAVAMSGAATSQARMNRLEEARRNLRDVVAQWDFLHQQEPTNNQFQRNRMLAYSHLGDLLGNPNYTNAGDTSGAMAAFRSMLSIAESLHRANPGDQAATIDYGMALARVATLPFGEVAERLAMYEKAAGLLEQARGRDRGNATLQINLAAQKEQTGDLLATAAKITEALEAYRAGLALAQGFTRPAGQRIALTISEKLASLLAKRGDVREALAHAARAVSVGEAAAADPSAVLATRVLKPRGYAAMGSVQTLLGKTAAARRWYERALKEFRLLEKDPAFTPAHRQFMHQVQEALRKR